MRRSRFRKSWLSRRRDRALVPQPGDLEERVLLSGSTRHTAHAAKQGVAHIALRAATGRKSRAAP